MNTSKECKALLFVCLCFFSTKASVVQTVSLSLYLIRIQITVRRGGKLVRFPDLPSSQSGNQTTCKQPLISTKGDKPREFLRIFISLHTHNRPPQTESKLA